MSDPGARRAGISRARDAAAAEPARRSRGSPARCCSGSASSPRPASPARSSSRSNRIARRPARNSTTPSNRVDAGWPRQPAARLYGSAADTCRSSGRRSPAISAGRSSMPGRRHRRSWRPMPRAAGSRRRRSTAISSSTTNFRQMAGGGRAGCRQPGSRTRRRRSAATLTSQDHKLAFLERRRRPPHGQPRSRRAAGQSAMSCRPAR